MLKKTVMVAATAASALALPTVAEARHYHRYSNYGYSYPARSYAYGGYGYRGYAYPRTTTVISVGSPGLAITAVTAIPLTAIRRMVTAMDTRPTVIATPAMATRPTAQLRLPTWLQWLSLHGNRSAGAAVGGRGAAIGSAVGHGGHHRQLRLLRRHATEAPTAAIGGVSSARSSAERSLRNTAKLNRLTYP